MKAATLNEIKRELVTLDQERLVELCLRLARFKKESKELLTYLLFESHREDGYVADVKDEMQELFGGISPGNLYYAKKSLRRILRIINRQIKYSGVKQTEVELRIYFCQMIRKSDIPVEKSPVLVNLYQNQLKKIRAALALLPDDLQFDYQQVLAEID